jgi:hypothetical protein
MIPQVSRISATLKTGNAPSEMKSLTPSKRILSRKFPSVPANRRINSHLLRRCFANRRKHAIIHRTDTVKIMPRGTVIPREIPVLNSGSKKLKPDQISKS